MRSKKIEIVMEMCFFSWSNEQINRALPAGFVVQGTSYTFEMNHLINKLINLNYSLTVLSQGLCMNWF